MVSLGADHARELGSVAWVERPEGLLHRLDLRVDNLLKLALLFEQSTMKQVQSSFLKLVLWERRTRTPSHCEARKRQDSDQTWVRWEHGRATYVEDDLLGRDVLVVLFVRLEELPSHVLQVGNDLLAIQQTDGSSVKM